MKQATTQGGYLAAAGALISVVFVSFLGAVSDVFGRKWLSVLSMSAYLFYFGILWLSTWIYKPVCMTSQLGNITNNFTWCSSFGCS